MKLTSEQFNDLLRRPSVAKANPILVGVVPAQREPHPEPALDKDACRQQAVCEGLEVSIALIAVRKRLLDDDNLIAGFKHLRDEVARTLGVDDADSRLKWSYGQVLGTRPGTIVKIEASTKLMMPGSAKTKAKAPLVTREQPENQFGTTSLKTMSSRRGL